MINYNKLIPELFQFEDTLFYVKDGGLHKGEEFDALEGFLHELGHLFSINQSYPTQQKVNDLLMSSLHSQKALDFNEIRVSAAVLYAFKLMGFDSNKIENMVLDNMLSNIYNRNEEAVRWCWDRMKKSKHTQRLGTKLVKQLEKLGIYSK